MFNELFSKLFLILLVIVLVVVLIGAGFSAYTIRNNMIESRMEHLLLQAREIAHLVSQETDAKLNQYLDVESSFAQYLQWKANRVYSDYSAYILIVDRNGRILNNINKVLLKSPDTVSDLTVNDIRGALRDVLSGREVITKIVNEADGTVFTVAVPMTENELVLGAVFIHTGAQIIETEYRDIVIQIILGFLIAAVLALVFAVFFTRSIVKPLTTMTKAAETMSQGDFSVRTDASGFYEVDNLARSFNIMASKLNMIEDSRREFVGNVSHELRSPITSIHGYVDGMLDGTIPEEEFPKYLRIVSDETMRMKRLIADLLELSRMEDGVSTLDQKDYDLHESIRRVLIGRMNDIDKKHVHLHLDFGDEPCYVFADQARIEQVIFNITDNAIKFLHNGGNLTIRTAMVHDIVTVSVLNDGASILPEDQPHVFERFYKSDKAHTVGKDSGTGLGLSICKRIVEMHGQTIRLVPTQKGAAFEFTLRKTVATRKPIARNTE
ncbi:MAG: HAMP domain-containing protein [Clostridiales bacterium]|nr:HAMP domain-containing protein [Clostridiales bacterium]